MSRPTTCDMPGCTGPRQILLMEDAMRCVCRNCWRRMTRPTPTTAAPVGYALYRPGEGIGFDRNGQLLIFKTQPDALYM